MSRNIWPLGPDCLLESFNISKFQADITVWPIAPHVVTLSSPSLHAALSSEQLAMSLLRTVTITGVLLVSLSHTSVMVRWKVNPPIIQDAWRPIEHWRWAVKQWVIFWMKNVFKIWYWEQGSVSCSKKKFSGWPWGCYQGNIVYTKWIYIQTQLMNIIQNSIILSPQSSRDRIKWYHKHCRKTGRFCQVQYFKFNSEQFLVLSNWDRPKVMPWLNTNKKCPLWTRTQGSSNILFNAFRLITC